MKVAGVVVLYNPDKNIAKNIETYLEKVARVYVVDNSGDGQFEKVLPSSRKIVYLPQHKNVGIAKALNIGAKEAIKDGFDFLLTMDQDSSFSKKAVDTLFDYLKTHGMEKVGILSPFQFIKSSTKDEIPKEEISEMDRVMTSGNLLNLTIYQKLDGFKEWLFIDCVDDEYCYNLTDHGYKVLRLNTAVMQHELGNIMTYHLLWKHPKESNHNYIRRYYIARNNRYVMELHNLPKSFRRTFYYNEFKQKLIILLFEEDKWRKIRNMCRGRRDFRRGVKGEYSYDN